MATLKEDKIQVFPYLGLALGKAFFLYTREVFASKWAREDFPYNSKYSLHRLIREPHRTINRINNNNILLLGTDKAVLKIIQLKEYNPKINWIIG